MVISIIFGGDEEKFVSKVRNKRMADQIHLDIAEKFKFDRASKGITNHDRNNHEYLIFLLNALYIVTK